MSELKATPGPWHIEAVDGPGFRAPGDDGAEDMCIVAANGLCPGIIWDFHSQGVANAHLIAAAWKMYHKLLEGIELEESDSVGSEFKKARNEWIRESKALLAEARGES